ncbi:MAG: ABC transporter ATP-binding protein [Caldilineaceae bacterium]
MTAVQLVSLSKHFDAMTAVDQLALAVDAGELVALLGPSGCGKTTTMRMLAGLLQPSSGDILFDDKSVLATPPERRGAVMVFQKHLLFPHMSVAENVGFGLKMRGVDRREIARRVSEMLALVQLPGYETRRTHQLSGGQQQRVALARALVIEPKVLLLDEPLANLDANLRLEMRKLIRDLQQALGITTIFVTHDQEEAVMLADRVALMVDGRLQQYTEPRAFYERPSSAVVARFFRNENLLPGTKTGCTVRTAIGDLCATKAAACADGAVVVTLRPEQIVIVDNGGANCVAATVNQVLYLGTYLQITVQLDKQHWVVHSTTDRNLCVGETVVLYLPPAQLWCMPAEP